ncbi:MAG: RNA degradosome polyphosphate kinase [Frankiaceae bacterium]
MTRVREYRAPTLGGLLRKPRSGLLEPLDVPKDLPPALDLPEGRFLNREASWLDFNARVLALAEHPETPLLERAKFLAIFAGNLDEFFMVRVAGLKRRQAAGLAFRSVDGLTLGEQLRAICERTSVLMARESACLRDQVLPGLAEEGIRLVHWDDLGEREHTRLQGYFREQVFPVLTPLAVDPAHPFPYISGLSLNLAVRVRAARSGGERFARVKVPPNVGRFVPVAAAAWMPLEELIAEQLPLLFPGMTVAGSDLFRVTRNADLEVEEDEAEDLLQALERELVRRRFGRAVRLEVDDAIDDEVLDLLLRELGVEDTEVVRVDGLLDLTALWDLHGLDRPELKDPPHVTKPHPRLEAAAAAAKDVFSVLRDGDVLVHHPYDSFTTSVQRFLEQAAADPHVLAIKQTLYRTSGDSPVIEALIDAAKAGKQVVVLVEIKARFNETANIKWARILEQAGCHVVYGLVGLKTHCKALLVVRQERGQLRRYCHLGTGNYNPKTARLYEDLGLLTAAPDVGADLTDLFNVLTGFSRQTEYRSLLVAPQHLRDGIVARIRGEAAAARAGRRSGIRIKINSLVDEAVIDELYRASRAGVPIECLVRGICTLRPGVPELSQTIRVRSILGRFLEHSRILHFQGTGELWIGSADAMHRNLDRRIETMVRVQAADLQAELTRILDLAFSPRVRAWELQPEGTWSQREVRDCKVLDDYQLELTALTANRLGTP